MYVVSSCFALVLLAAAGCGGEAVAPDAGTPDAASDAAGRAAPPSIPWLDEARSPAVLTPCPDGWRTVEDDLGASCDPYGPEGPLTCAAGEAHFPGESACRPVGDGCPTGDFAAGLPNDGTVVYVSASAAPGGDGSLGRPYAGLGEVNVGLLPTGTTVALGKGVYGEAIALRGGVHVVGACAAETLLTGTAFSAPAIVSVTIGSEPAVLRNVTLSNAPQRAAVVGSGRALRLEGVVIERATSVAIAVTQAGSTLEFVDSVVRGTRSTSVAGDGIGAFVADGGSFTATRAIFAGNEGTGLYAGVGGEATLANCVVRDTRSPDPSRLSFGVVVQGGTLDATALLVSHNAAAGLQAAGPATVVRLTDVIVQDSQPVTPDGLHGRGFQVADGARLEATRLLVARNRDVAMFFERDAEVSLIDTVVRDTQPNRGGTDGRGIQVQSGAQVTASGLLVAGNRTVALQLGPPGAGAQVTLTDAWLRDTEPQLSDAVVGMGIVVADGSRLDASRLAVTNNHYMGIVAVGDGTQVTLRDTVVAETLPAQVDLTAGHGIHVGSAAVLDGERVRIEGTSSAGLVTTEAAVTMHDLTVARVQRAACEATTCPDQSYGYGVAAQGGALDLERFEIREAATCGVFLSELLVATAPEVDLRAGIVSDAAIGACVQVEAYDLGRLTDDVVYRDNGTNLDATALPVPELPVLH